MTFRDGPAVPVPTPLAGTTTFMSGYSAATGGMSCWAWYPGDAPSATWTLDCSAAGSPDGVDLQGPYIQGPPGGRFIYLSWGTVDDAQTFTLFRRAKLSFDAIPQAVIDGAQRLGMLVGRLGLTDAKGKPLCAAVRPPLIEWSAEAA